MNTNDRLRMIELLGQMINGLDVDIIEDLYLEVTFRSGQKVIHRAPDYPPDMPEIYRGRCPDCGRDGCVCDEEEP